MRILLLTEIFPPAKGGSGRWLWELYRRLDEFDVEVVASRAEGADAFDKTSGMPTVRIPLSFPNWGIWDPRGAAHYARALYSLNKIAARVRPDEIHCGKCLPEGFLAL